MSISASSSKRRKPVSASAQLSIAVVPGSRAKGAAIVRGGPAFASTANARAKAIAAPGDQVVIAMPDMRGPNAVPESSAPLWCAWKRASGVVENPPASRRPPSKTVRGHARQALVGHYRRWRGSATHRANRDRHRLATDTVRPVLAARSEAAFEVLSKGLKAGAATALPARLSRRRSRRVGRDRDPHRHHPRTKTHVPLRAPA